MIRRRNLWLSLVLGIACAPVADPSAFPQNTCRGDGECWEGARCYTELSVCGRDESVQAYRVVLQVSPGDPQFPRVTLPSLSLAQSNTEHTLALPNPLTVSGRVTADAGNIHAEVTFRPQPEQRGYPTAGVSVTSVSSQDPGFTVPLPPRTTFEVYIRPLGNVSATLPPVVTEFRTEEVPATFEYSYPSSLLRLEKTLVSAPNNEPLVGHWVRLRHAITGQVISSVQKTDELGQVTLAILPPPDTTMPSVLQTGEYVLQVDLNREPDLPDPAPAAPKADGRMLEQAPRWSEIIEVPAARVASAGNSPLVLPRIPARVVLTGGVEAQQDLGPSNADLTFVSRFPVPRATGELRDRDWCRTSESSAELPPITCLASHSVSTDAEGDFAVPLLPGDYEVFIAPAPESDDAQGRQRPGGAAPRRVATSQASQFVETQPGGGDQGPSVFQLDTAKLLTGIISNPSGTPLPNMVVRSVALGLRGLFSEAALYNRPSSSVTDAHGQFALALDEGYYDVVGEPPAGSGYPRLYYANRKYQLDTGPKHLTLQAPVILAGAVVTAEQEPLPDASIDAFAIVPDLRGYDRAVLIGQAVSDAEGRYMLVLPPEILIDSNASP